MATASKTVEPTDPGLRHYSDLLDRLFWLRAVGPVSDDIEEFYSEALNDCRREMSPEAAKLVDELVTQKKALQAASDLDLEDTEPEEQLTDYPRREVHL
ncbi:MAG TPA: hypothetical protein VHO06_28170 [Polyangia bacterium]|nr:hypothetical protein [Polyangia bacterium]